jgi:integrase
MAIYKTDKGYRVQVDVGRKLGGGRDRRSKVCATKKDAQRAEARFNMLREVGNGRSGRITFADFVREFYLPDVEGTLRGTTLVGYNRDLKLRLLPAFGEMNVGDIGRLQIQSMIDRCPTYKTGKNARDTLSAVLSLALDMELLNRNPARAKFKYKPKKAQREASLGDVVTSFSEHMRIIRLANTYDAKAILVLGLCFGLRKGEILALDWENIDLDGRCLHVYQTYTQGKGKAELTDTKTPKSTRDLPISRHALGLLKELRSWGGAIRLKGPVLAYKGRRMAPAMAYRRLVQFCAANSDTVPNITTSSMRHSFATAAILSGINVASVSKWLGHTNVSTTLNRYVVPLMGDLTDEAMRIDSLYESGAQRTA